MTGVDIFHKYNFLWEGSNQQELAVFLTLIRDSLSPNMEEDLKLIEETKGSTYTYPSGIQIPFGLSLEPGKVTAAIYGADNGAILNSFSYLAADSIPGNALYIAGVVHPQGYIPLTGYLELTLGSKFCRKTTQSSLFRSPKSYTKRQLFWPFPSGIPRKTESFPRHLVMLS